MAPPVDESKILKAKDPSIIDNNEWPDFTLTQADVYDATTGVPTSLLFADTNNPLTVVGKIEKLPHDRLRYLADSASLPATILISNVDVFSYGQYDEGKAALWAAGEAGWFELKPSRAYRSIFNDMVEAVNMLYFTADYYRDMTRHKLKTTPPESIFEMYAAEPTNKCRDVEHATSTFHKHVRFLLASMRTGKEGIAWKSTQLFKYLEREASQSVSPDEEQNPLESKQAMSMQRATPEAERPIRPGNGKSVLRPRSDRLSMKGAGQRHSPADDEVDDTAAKTNGELTKGSSLLKRKSTDLQDDRATRRQKRANITEDEVISPAEDERNVPDRAIPLSSRPRTAKVNKSEPILYIKEQSLPSYEPQGPGDTWTCTFDGCVHRVYGASMPKSRELIKEHYRKHAFSAQAQIDLVYKEERPYLPVGNLIQKIRALAARRDIPGTDVEQESADTPMAG